jgi:hypothetical protein
MPSGDDDAIVARRAPLLVFEEFLVGERLLVELFAGERFFGELLTGEFFFSALLAAGCSFLE